MIIIPELERVVIQPPRTGSTSLRVAIAERYPKSFYPYHHMEHEGIPHGYDHWTSVGIMRNPVERLFSMYKYMGSYTNPNTDQQWIANMRKDVDRSFGDWLMYSTELFTDAYIGGRFNPLYSVINMIPAVIKPQSSYIGNSDSILWLEDVERINEYFDISLPLINQSTDEELNSLSTTEKNHFIKCHGNDLELFEQHGFGNALDVGGSV